MYDEQQWILKRAQLTPTKQALIEIETNRTWTYSQLAKEINTYTQELDPLDIQDKIQDIFT